MKVLSFVATAVLALGLSASASFRISSNGQPSCSILQQPGATAMAIVGNVILKINGQLTISGGGIVNGTQNASALTIVF